MRVSVILPCYNRSGFLRETLRIFTEQVITLIDFEVIIVDDGSTDDAIEWLSNAKFPFEFHLLQQANRGPGAARNHGAKIAQGELLIFLDADMVPTSGLIPAYLDAYDQNPRAILIGRMFAWTEAYQTLFDQVTGIEANHDLGSTLTEPRFYHLASGNFAIPKGIFDGLNGFDESLAMTEDTDLGYRAYKMGIELVYCSNAIGKHNHPKTFQQRCNYSYESARWTARLSDIHPGIENLLPIYQEVLPINWKKDNTDLIIRKLTRQVLALNPINALMDEFVRLLEKYWPQPSLLRFLYWKILTSYRLNGYRKGLRLYSGL